MTKLKKAIIIILCFLVAAFGGFSLTYCLKFGLEALKALYATAWDWLNQPLPIVSVSIVFIGTFVLKVLANSTWGKKAVARLKEEHENFKLTATETEETLKKALAEAEGEAAKLREQIDYLTTKLQELCEGLRNKTAEQIAKELIEHGKETTEEENSPTED